MACNTGCSMTRGPLDFAMFQSIEDEGPIARTDLGVLYVTLGETPMIYKVSSRCRFFMITNTFANFL